jgi:hypothetical protein
VYKALDLERIMRYWIKVTVCVLLTDLKNVWPNFSICMFQHTLSIIKRLWFAFWRVYVYRLVYIKTCSNWVCIKLEYVLYCCYLYIHMWCFNPFYIFFYYWNVACDCWLKSYSYSGIISCFDSHSHVHIAFLGYIFPPVTKMLYKVLINIAINYVLYAHSWS